MSATDLLGWAASAMTLLTFASRDMRLLRFAALSANAAFIGYGILAHLWPVLALHMTLVPVNALRLRELFQHAGAQGRNRNAPGTALTRQSGPAASSLTRAAGSTDTMRSDGRS